MGVLLAKIDKQSHSHQRAKGLIPPRWGINAQILSASVLIEASVTLLPILAKNQEGIGQPLFTSP